MHRKTTWHDYRCTPGAADLCTFGRFQACLALERVPRLRTRVSMFRRSHPWLKHGVEITNRVFRPCHDWQRADVGHVATTGHAPIGLVFNREQPCLPVRFNHGTVRAFGGFGRLMCGESVEMPKRLRVLQLSDFAVGNDPAPDLALALAHGPAPARGD